MALEQQLDYLIYTFALISSYAPQRIRTAVSENNSVG